MTTGAAFAKGYSDSINFRIFIGTAEAGFKPGVKCHFAGFYTRKEVGVENVGLRCYFV
jgi:hypothetical protein